MDDPNEGAGRIPIRRTYYAAAKQSGGPKLQDGQEDVPRAPEDVGATAIPRGDPGEGDPGEGDPGEGDPGEGDKDRAQPPPYRVLSPTERENLARSVGAAYDKEAGATIPSRSWCFPTRGMKQGLYKNVVRERAMWFWYYQMASSTRWTFMIFHIVVSAVLAVLGQRAAKTGTEITTLATVNTVLAGFLALIHNSGLPDRYRNNMAEFEEVEDHIRELLDTGLAPAKLTIEQVIADCFDRFHDAKAAVFANMPTMYNSKLTLRAMLPGAKRPQGGPGNPVTTPPGAGVPT